MGKEISFCITDCIAKRYEEMLEDISPIQDEILIAKIKGQHGIDVSDSAYIGGLNDVIVTKYGDLILDDGRYIIHTEGLCSCSDNVVKFWYEYTSKQYDDMNLREDYFAILFRIAFDVCKSNDPYVFPYRGLCYMRTGDLHGNVFYEIDKILNNGNKVIYISETLSKIQIINRYLSYITGLSLNWILNSHSGADDYAVNALKYGSSILESKNLYLCEAKQEGEGNVVVHDLMMKEKESIISGNVVFFVESEISFAEAKEQYSNDKAVIVLVKCDNN